MQVLHQSYLAIFLRRQKVNLLGNYTKENIGIRSADERVSHKLTFRVSLLIESANQRAKNNSVFVKSSIFLYFKTFPIFPYLVCKCPMIQTENKNILKFMNCWWNVTNSEFFVPSKTKLVIILLLVQVDA